MGSENALHLGTYLGHQYVLTPKAIVWIRVIVVYVWNRNGGVFAQIVHCCHLRLSFQPWHELTRNTSNDVATIGKCYKICLADSVGFTFGPPADIRTIPCEMSLETTSIRLRPGMCSHGTNSPELRKTILPTSPPTFSLTTSFNTLLSI
jgi:hypothetical protein